MKKTNHPIPPIANRLMRTAQRVQAIVDVFSKGVSRLGPELGRTRLGKTTGARLAVRVVQELGDDDATHMAASVSYYAVLSLFPLILGLSAIVGVLASSPARQDQLLEFVVDYLPGSEVFIKESLAGVSRFRAAFGIVSLVSLLWAASAIFGSITRAVNRAWDVKKDPPFYKNKPRQLAMAAGVSLLFFLSVGMTSVFQWATTISFRGTTVADFFGGWVVAAVLEIPALVLGFVIFALIYKMLPNTHTEWRYIWLGAVIAAVLFEASKNLFLWYLHNFASYDQVYGNVSSVIILMVWTYFSAFILILGAEIASEFGRLKHEVERGHDVPEG